MAPPTLPIPPTPLPPDPASALLTLDPEAIRERIAHIDRERDALLVLLRAALRAQRGRKAVRNDR